MKHDSTHKLDVACLDCVRKLLEHKKKLMAFVEYISDESHDDDDCFVTQARELLKEIEEDND